MKNELIPVLLDLEEIKFVIKRGTAYSCIATETLKFLDITNFLAVGVNYDSFLKAYDASVSKSYFCYEWFSDLSKLNTTIFPDYDAFYSSLKGTNTLEPVKGETLTEGDIAIIGREPTKQTPLTRQEIQLIGSARYNGLQSMFYENNWTFKDYLIFYNNRYEGRRAGGGREARGYCVCHAKLKCLYSDVFVLSKMLFYLVYN